MSDLLARFDIHPNVRFTTWEDYAILSMVEKGLGIDILPQMILQRIPYEVEVRPLATPYYREIGLAMKDRKRLSPAEKNFCHTCRCGKTGRRLCRKTERTHKKAVCCAGSARRTAHFI